MGYGVLCMGAGGIGYFVEACSHMVLRSIRIPLMMQSGECSMCREIFVNLSPDNL